MVEQEQPAVYRRDIHELLHHDQYTPEEAAFLLGMDVDALKQAAHRHELPAVIASHEVLYILRADLIHWLEKR